MRTFTEFFGFNQDPFKRTPDIDFYYPTKMHQEALDTLNYLIYSDEPFAVITGEPGTGKTITLRKFISELPSNIVCAYILFPNLSPEELFMAILEDFNINVDRELTKNKLFARLRDFLLDVSQEGKKAVIIVDEAQNLPVETLEELRILSNLETEKDKLLKIILAGQPELNAKLEQESLRQLKQRVTLYTSLGNIKDEDIGDYINSHLDKVGKNNIKIQHSVVRKISKATKGNPRLINTLMERTIIAAFLDNSYTITEEHLKSAISSINNIISTSSRGNAKKVLQLLSVASAGILLGFGVYSVWDKVQKPGVDKNQPTLVETKTVQEVSIAKADNSIENKQITQEPTNKDVSILDNQVSNSSDQKVETTTDIEDDNSIDTVDVVDNTDINTNTDMNATNINQDISIVNPKREVSILVNSLNVRGKPDLEANRVGAVTLGNKYEYISEFGEWVEIRLSPTLTGWVFKRYVSISR